MKTPTSATSLLRQLVLSPQRSILESLIPGATNMATFAQQLLKGKGTTFTYLVYLIGILTATKPVAINMTCWLQKYFTSTVHIQSSNETYDMLASWITSRGLENAARSFLAKEGPGYYNEKISVTCLGRSSVILKDLLKECQEEYLSHIENSTTIFGHSGAQWKKEKAKRTRPLSTVILRENEKNSLIQDMKDFLEPQTRSWYSEHSIPYRRGYLLHGPPGTGKSSFSFSIAGELGMNIYVVSIPSVDDESLKTLFEELPDTCVVLLEDIDAVGSVYCRELERPNNDLEPGKEKKGVTLSGLLNVLDGVASQEDRVLIMTTNHIDKLDPALIRPGRVDKKVKFQLADREVTMQIYKFIFGQPTEQSSKKTSHAKDDPSIERQAIEFARRVPEEQLSPAQIISYLLQHRHMPRAALTNVGKWVEALRAESDQHRNFLE
ncbi:hypothetical protein PENANT_c105G01098 [Penicillium antarcticum]|uniref:AAA+ ATPase domain-containing protein n=1 Tax=Penicillium antarcticum TaxID=416450 RepID=A0A1V6PK36_9EURO|nr:uncharacterized protein N7508_011129 [Penicillium antarcticum]KAJ5288354.1 hypothetical protein N7508_011129 [Penicillium antarcticum]OQD77410.1 hypothetical protein PENANT_c105G01098 [Penicillium antarcticum]